MFLASLAALMAPILLALSRLFTMNAFDPLLWTAIAFLIVRIVRSCNEHLWVAVGALAGVTILNKYAFLFWLSGVVLGVCLTPLRQSLRYRWLWFGCALAAAIAFPNFLWQWQHRFPFLELMHNVRESGGDIVLPPLPLSPDSGPDARLCRRPSRALCVPVLHFLAYERKIGTSRRLSDFGSIPMQSLTADRIRCLQPRYRLVV
jgi:hypothetical protein